MEEYKPGVCNIGKKEIRKRYLFGAAGLVAAILLAYVIVAFHLPKLSLIASFIFFMLGFEGLYQGHFKFCAGFASAGIYDLTGSGGKRSKVTDKESHRIDMKRAMRIHALSIISALILTIVIFLFI